MGNNSFIYRSPGINIKIPGPAIKSVICKFDKLHKKAEYNSKITCRGKKRANRKRL